MLRATAEPPPPAPDDSWLLDLDVTGLPGLPDIWPQDESIAGPQSNTVSYYGTPDPARHRGSKSRRNTPDQGQRPPREVSYALGDLFTNNPWEVESMVQSGINLSRPFNEEAFDCFATDSFPAEPTTFGSGSREPANSLVPLSCSKGKTRKRRRLSDSTKEKMKSVRRVGACLRCRIYKEPVYISYTL